MTTFVLPIGQTQEQEEQPPANTFREKLARFAQPRKTQSVRVCMNGKVRVCIFLEAAAPSLFGS